MLPALFEEAEATSAHRLDRRCHAREVFDLDELWAFDVGAAWKRRSRSPAARRGAPMRTRATRTSRGEPASGQRQRPGKGRDARSAPALARRRAEEPQPPGEARGNRSRPPRKTRQEALARQGRPRGARGGAGGRHRRSRGSGRGNQSPKEHQGTRGCGPASARGSRPGAEGRGKRSQPATKRRAREKKPGRRPIIPETTGGGTDHRREKHGEVGTQGTGAGEARVDDTQRNEARLAEASKHRGSEGRQPQGVQKYMRP